MEFTEIKVGAESIFDTHAHYDSEIFADKESEIIKLIKENGIYKVINCACDASSIKSTLLLTQKHPFIYAALGYHPEEIEKGTDLVFLKNSIINNKKVVAVGEIGLDFHYRDDNKAEQKKAFISQIELANELDLPVIIHDRDAHADTLEIIKKHKPKGVLHCFSGSEETANEVLKLGMYIGVGGAITFKNAKKLPEIVKNLPSDRILFETDCPYMAPEPFRGKMCHSAMIYYVAEKVAALRNTSADKMLEITKANAERLFFGV